LVLYVGRFGLSNSGSSETDQTPKIAVGHPGCLPGLSIR
jgi:hypothetical protein